MAPHVVDLTVGDCALGVSDMYSLLRATGEVGGTVVDLTCDLGDCPICLDTVYDSDISHACNHCSKYFHRGCHDRWLQNAPGCPLCRFEYINAPCLKRARDNDDEEDTEELEDAYDYDDEDDSDYEPEGRQ
jgi:hypothetical protein